MKFFCEYCGNRIDAEKDHKCPHCGASYKKNETFKKLEEEKKQRQQMVTEQTQKVFKHVFGMFAFSKFLILIPIVIFVVMFIIIISNVNNQSNKNKVDDIEQSDFFENLLDKNTNSEKEDIITVGLNEYAETKKYKVKVTKYEVVEDTFNRLDDSYEYVKFYLVVENISDKQLIKEDVYCIVDGISQTNDFTSGYSDLPMFIPKNLTVTGTATFEIPVGTNSYDIRYGDYVTIHIEK